jgi:hypothetical protein
MCALRMRVEVAGAGKNDVDGGRDVLNVMLSVHAATGGCRFTHVISLARVVGFWGGFGDCYFCAATTHLVDGSV